MMHELGAMGAILQKMVIFFKENALRPNVFQIFITIRYSSLHNKSFKILGAIRPKMAIFKDCNRKETRGIRDSAILRTVVRYLYGKHFRKWNLT